MSTILDKKRFDELNKGILFKKNLILKLKNEIQLIETNILIDRKSKYALCTHEFVKECTMGGCYPEYELICKYCRKSN